MTEDDTEAVEIIKKATGQDYSAAWARQGQSVETMMVEIPMNAGCMKIGGTPLLTKYGRSIAICMKRR